MPPRYERTNGRPTPPCKPGAGTTFGESGKPHANQFSKGGEFHCDGYRIGDSRHTGGKPAPVCAKEPYRLEVLEMRPDRRKGKKLSAKFKGKTPPLCTGGSGLLHTKCVSISVKPLRTHYMTKFSIWFKTRLRQKLRPVVQWAYCERASRLKGVRYEREAVGARKDHSVV